MPMRIPPPWRGALILCFWVFLLFVVSCSSTIDQRRVEVIGVGECAEYCKKNNIKNSHAVSGLRVSIDCKSPDGHFQTRGEGKLDEEGTFSVALPGEIVEDGKLKEECFAQLHSALAAPCPAINGLDSSKIVFKSRSGDKHTFEPALKLQFSPPTCTSAFFLPYFKFPPLPKFPHFSKLHHHLFPKLPHPPFKSFGFPFPPKFFPPFPKFKKPLPPFVPKKPLPPPVPVYQKPLPPPVPLYKKPLPPPVRVHKKPLPPPVPIYKKPLPPPVPIYKKPLPPPTPAYKKPCPPPVPILKKPLPPFTPKKPLPPSVPIFKKPLPPPTPVYKPIPPIFKHPFSKPFFKKPFPHIPFFKPHPLFPKLPPFLKKPYLPIHKFPLPKFPTFPGIPPKH